MPNIHRSRKLLGCHGSNELVKVFFVLEQGDELVDFNASRLVKHFNKLAQVIMFELDRVFLQNTRRSVHEVVTTGRKYTFKWINLVHGCGFDFECKTVRFRFVSGPAHVIGVLVPEALINKSPESARTREQTNVTSFSEHLPKPQNDVVHCFRSADGSTVSCTRCPSEVPF